MRPSILFLACSAASVAASPEHANEDCRPFLIDMIIKDNTKVEATIVNNRDHDIKILNDGTFFQDFPIRKAFVSSKDKPATFRGIGFDMILDRLKNPHFKKIGKGKSVKVKFDLADLYDLSDGGEFEVLMKGTFRIADMKNMITCDATYVSETKKILVEGDEVATPWFSKKLPDLKECKYEGTITIEHAMDECVDIAEAAAEAARSGPADLLEEFFESSNNETRQVVAKVFDNVALECKDPDWRVSTYTCPNKRCHNDWVAYGDPYNKRIVFCKRFFESKYVPADGRCNNDHSRDKNRRLIGRPFVIIRALIQLDAFKDTADWGYGFHGMKGLATSLDYATPYEYFARAARPGC